MERSRGAFNRQVIRVSSERRWARTGVDARSAADPGERSLPAWSPWSAGLARTLPGVTLTLDGDSEVREDTCGSCGEHSLLVTSFVMRDGAAYAVAKTALHHHDGYEAWVDLVFGSWHEDADDHLTFGCRVGPVAGSPDPAATAVDAAKPYGESPFWGQKLSRTGALAHPRLDEFWLAVDFLLVSEPRINHHVYHH